MVEHWLNGKCLLVYELDSPEWRKLIRKLVSEGKFARHPDYDTVSKGRVALQENGSSVWFRNIKIREM